MSQQKKIIKEKALETVLEKISLSEFEGLAVDLLEERRFEKTVFDFSLMRSFTGYEDVVGKELAKKHNIEEASLGMMLNGLVYLLRGLFTKKRSELLKEFEQNRKMRDKAGDLVKIADRLDKRFPDIRERFYVTTCSKTNFLGDIDWEIVIKAIEAPVYGFEKSERFPVCVLRVVLEKSVPIVRPYTSTEPRSELTFEASSSDLDRMISTLLNIKKKMTSLRKELAMEEQK